MIILREYENGVKRLFYNLDRYDLEKRNVKECTTIEKAKEIEVIYKKHFPWNFSERTRICIFVAYLLRKNNYERLKMIDN